MTSDGPLPEADDGVWVVERNPGTGWRVSAVLTSFEDAEQYEDDLREFFESYPDEFPDEYKHGTRTRHGGRNSPAPFYEEYPPDSENGGIDES